jgi:hypothetical protein
MLAAPGSDHTDYAAIARRRAGRGVLICGSGNCRLRLEMVKALEARHADG